MRARRMFALDEGANPTITCIFFPTVLIGGRITCGNTVAVLGIAILFAAGRFLTPLQKSL
jgi:hypothetical protein